MKIISFAWTTRPLLERKKTVTRRCWTDDYANRFKRADLVKAYDKSPRFGGKHVATIRLTKDPYKQSLVWLTKEDLVKEGDLWESVGEFISAMDCVYPWVIEFELVEIIGRQKERK
jgi:hypothetical protein